MKVRTNYYSAPVKAGTAVQVKVQPAATEVWQKGVRVARHERCYECGQQILNLEHYLEVLERKPGALAGSVACLNLLAGLKRTLNLYPNECGSVTWFRQVLCPQTRAPAALSTKAYHACRSRNDVPALPDRREASNCNTLTPPRRDSCRMRHKDRGKRATHSSLSVWKRQRVNAV